MTVRFRLLGEVAADVEGRPVELGHARQRCVLAVLLLEANRIVPVATLAERLWGERLPPSRYSALYSYLSRLRRALADAAGVSIVRAANGYRLAVDEETVDLFRFQRRVARARTADDETAVVLLDEALRLWRGDAFAGLDMPWVHGMREILHEQRLAAWLDRNDVRLRRGDRAGMLDELYALSAEHPRDERLAAQLMLALYHAGRTAEALEHYQMLRKRLAEELGVDPGPALDRLHQDILRGAVEPQVGHVPDLGVEPQQPHPQPVAREPAAPVAAKSGAARLVPRQLPAPPQMFTGRVPELAQLGQVHDASTVVVITAIDGMAGVGKTTLAVRAAHQIADRYPDGQLFIDLHGYTQGVDPVEPGEALDHLLRALGVPGPQIPERLDQRAALYRTRLAGQRMLVVLDNAAAESQVVPLLPGSTGCLVLVTSRRRLAGLDHTLTLSLDTMPVPDAVALFTRSVGEGRLEGQPAERLAELTELVELTGRLPLAIRIAAARLRSHPTWRLGDLVARLRDRQHRLGELEAGQRSVTTALDMSYHHLDPDQQRAYRLLGLHPGPDIDAYATAALLDSTVTHAGRLLDQLHDAHLLQEPAPGRYRFHDLTRAHAAHIAGTQTDPGGQVAVGRLLGYYRHTASAAVDTAYPYEREYRPRLPPARTPIPKLADPSAALTWLDIELPNLMATVRHADHDQPEHIGHLSGILHRDLAIRGRYHEAETLHHQALLTARATGHQASQLGALTNLSHIHRLQGRHEQAIDHLERAMQIAQAIGHRPGELDALANLSHIHREHGRHEQATDHAERALQIAQAIGHRPGELDALTNLANNHREQGRYEQAIDHLERALQIARATGHQYGQQYALTILGSIHHIQGRHEMAIDHLERALQMAQAIGHRRGELISLTILSAIHRLQGRYEQATDYYHRLNELAHQTGDRNFEFEAIQSLGRLRNATGDPAAAIGHYHRALALAGELAQPSDQARAHDGLAHAHLALNQPEQAGSHWQKALDILTGLGVDNADDAETTVAAIRTHLTRLNR